MHHSKYGSLCFCVNYGNPCSSAGIDLWHLKGQILCQMVEVEAFLEIMGLKAYIG